MSTARENYLAAKQQFAETFQRHLENGVEFISDNVYIDPEVIIAPGATILPGCNPARGDRRRGRLCDRAEHPAREYDGRRKLHRQCKPVL